MAWSIHRKIKQEQIVHTSMRRILFQHVLRRVYIGSQPKKSSSLSSGGGAVAAVIIRLRGKPNCVCVEKFKCFEIRTQSQWHRQQNTKLASTWPEVAWMHRTYFSLALFIRSAFEICMKWAAFHLATICCQCLIDSGMCEASSHQNLIIFLSTQSVLIFTFLFSYV